MYSECECCWCVKVNLCLFEAVWQVCLILVHLCMAITLSDAGSSLCVCVNYTANYISLPVSLGFLFPSPVVETEFNDTRCGSSELVCPNDPLLYTCNVIGITEYEDIKIIVPFNVVLFDPSGTILFGRLPVGYTLESFASLSNSSCRLSLAIDRASRLYGGSIKCGEYMAEKVAAVCPVAECKTIEESMTMYCVSHTSLVPGSPLNLHQISSASTDSSVVVQWESPVEQWSLHLRVHSDC